MKKSIQTQRRKARLASGLAGKEKQILCLQSPWMKGFKVHCGGRGGEGRRDPERTAMDTKWAFSKPVWILLHITLFQKV